MSDDMRSTETLNGSVARTDGGEVEVQGAGADTVRDRDRQAREAAAARDEQGNECGGRSTCEPTRVW